MQTSAFAEWLDTAFAGFDYAVFEALHQLAVTAGDFFTPLLWLVSLSGEKGALILIAAVVLLLFKHTRKVGLCLFFAVAIGAAITNLGLKELVARPRPFDSSALYYEWWQAVGSQDETDLAFPSGHVTAATAAAVALILSVNKPAAWLALLYPVAMAASRMYFIVHYATDVVGGIIVGTIAAFLAYWLITRLMAYAHKRHPELYSKLFPVPQGIS